jgi:hypothetical protein
MENYIELLHAGLIFDAGSVVVYLIIAITAGVLVLGQRGGKAAAGAAPPDTSAEPGPQPKDQD